jgi:hypothetical protein
VKESVPDCDSVAVHVRDGDGNVGVSLEAVSVPSSERVSVYVSDGDNV